MNIHEYQAKELLSRFDVRVPKGKVASSLDEARDAAKEIGMPCVVKAQIHAGGRGKAGGVKVVHTADEAAAFAASLLGKPLITHQTGPEGRKVRRVWLEEASDIEREFYLAMVIDTTVGLPAIVASSEGGMEIEEVAQNNPEKVITEIVDPLVGVMPFQVRRIARGLGLSFKEAAALEPLIGHLFRAFLECDCMQLEINPLAQVADGRLVALDAKMNFDANALFRQKDIAALRDVTEEDPKEVEASKVGISYVALNGNIGCMVNGAGLAMGTMDIIQQFGGSPANFLDVGGGASKEMVGKAFRLLLSDTKVRGVLVNIFGGIMRCDVIAAGIVEAAKETAVSVPLVVRLQGTNVELGREILSNSDLQIVSADTMADAAQRIVQAVGEQP